MPGGGQIAGKLGAMRSKKHFNLRFLFVLVALITATASFVILLGLTPVRPEEVVLQAVVINLFFVVCLSAIIVGEFYRLFRARTKGKAAARLHIRIVGLFSVIAIVPAILVAIIASITLDVGLDRWFSLRTKAIVSSALDVASAYEYENAVVLNGQVLSMGQDLDSARALYSLDRNGFLELFNRQARGRGLKGAMLVRADSTSVLKSDMVAGFAMPPIPDGTISDAQNGLPVLIKSGRTNLVGAVLKLRNISNAYLYVVRELDADVIKARGLMEDANSEYNNLEEGRSTLQIAFGVLFIGFALILLLSAIWMAIAVADRLVRPIRRLMTAADEVATGDLDISVPVHSSDGDIGALTMTFNNMVSEMKTQRDEIIETRDQSDERRRFTEAVLSGVSAGVIGIDADQIVTIANKPAIDILDQPDNKIIGRKIDDIAPGFGAIFLETGLRDRNEFRSQVTTNSHGKELTLDVKVTREESHDGHESFVVTVDDITDLLIAQRSSAWSDVARRIAHEIKNPLTPIQLSAERIKRRFGKHIPDDGKDVFDQCTETIIRQVGDIGRMVNEFSSFARMPKAVKSQQDLRDIVKDSLFSVEVSRSDISFSHDMPDHALMGEFDARMLGQAFGNLIKNATEAIDALPEADKKDHKAILVKTYAAQNGHDFIVDVIDNGSGLPKENRHRLLEPYMTMREKGTGLGLAIVKKIAEDHDGRLELHDAPKEFDAKSGAMFRVVLSKIAQSGNKQDKPGSANYGSKEQPLGQNHSKHKSDGDHHIQQKNPNADQDNELSTIKEITGAD